MNKRVLLGMSGGVDSSVAAVLLKEAGYEVVGVTMVLSDKGDGSCGDSRALTDARAIAEKLGIEHHALDFTKEFKGYVIDYFIDEYAHNRTPNPCTVCNKYLKFGAMYNAMKEYNCSFMSTGHYARTGYSEKYNQVVLKKAENIKKDQTYFLYNIPADITDRLIFPLEKYESKDEIRQIAREHGLFVASKPDSEDACFIPDGDYKKFLEENSDIRPNPGEVITTEGMVIGKHEGLYRYTIGQRKGLGIAWKYPIYVTGFDIGNNRLIVGKEEELYSSEFFVDHLNLTILKRPAEPFVCCVKTRYSVKEYECTVYPEGDRFRVVLETPRRAVTPGQSAVFYDGDIMLGGGRIV